MIRNPLCFDSISMLRVLLLSLLLGLSACAVTTTTREVLPPEAELAESLYRDGAFEAAAQAFIDAANAPRSPRDRFLLRAAESWREEGRLDQAEAILSRVALARLPGSLQRRMRLLEAEIALSKSQPERALELLAGRDLGVDDPSALRHYELRARALELLDRPVEAAAARARLDLVLPGEERFGNARELNALLTRLDDEQLRAAAMHVAENDPLRTWMGAALSQRGMRVPWSATGMAMPGEHIEFADADGYAPPRRIALLLPQHGPLATAAQSVRDGLLAAYFAETRIRPDLRIYDSGTETGQALASYDLASNEGADLVIGPLSREAVAALFERGQLRTPVLALNRAGNLPPPPGSQSFSLSPDEEAAAAAERFARRGIARVITIGDSDESSLRSLEAFTQRFEQRGGEIVSHASLPEDSPNFGPVLRQSFGHLKAPTPPALLYTIQGEPPTPDFDGVFLALRAAQARLLISQLKVIGIEGLPIFATSMIQGSESDPRLDKELDGVEFTTLPWLIDAAVGVAPRDELAPELSTAQGPGARLFAFGHDAFRLSVYMRHLGARRDASIFGATGELSLDGFGQVQRIPAWARFRNGRARPAEGALQTDVSGP